MTLVTDRRNVWNRCFIHYTLARFRQLGIVFFNLFANPSLLSFRVIPCFDIFSFLSPSFLFFIFCCSNRQFLSFTNRPLIIYFFFFLLLRFSWLFFIYQMFIFSFRIFFSLFFMNAIWYCVYIFTLTLAFHILFNKLSSGCSLFVFLFRIFILFWNFSFFPNIVRIYIIF